MGLFHASHTLSRFRIQHNSSIFTRTKKNLITLANSTPVLRCHKLKTNVYNDSFFKCTVRVDEFIAYSATQKTHIAIDNNNIWFIFSPRENILIKFYSKKPFSIVTVSFCVRSKHEERANLKIFPSVYCKAKLSLDTQKSTTSVLQLFYNCTNSKLTFLRKVFK